MSFGAAFALFAQSAERRPAVQAHPVKVFGYRDFTEQARWDAAFLRVPDAALAREHLRRLTAAPHWASSPEDYRTAEYVAERFRAAGLDTEFVPYRVLMNRPVSIAVQAYDSTGRTIFSGPTPEHAALDGDGPQERLQNDPRVLPGFNGSSPSGDVTAGVVYANYGRLVDFQRLDAMHVSLRGKIVLVRYGGDFRGVKVYLAEHSGAVGVLIYSDPADGGYGSGAPYPNGPYRPDTAVQRGSVQFMPVYPGDPTTPGVASVPGLPASHRLSGRELRFDQPSIPVNPLSSADALPILRALGGAGVPREWQGGLGFAYHVGDAAEGVAGAVRVHMRLVQETKLRTVWDVIGRIPGTTAAGEWVIAGNHRDAWVYGAADPGSGTAAMLEAVHGLGELLKQGWRPRRTIIVASWDAEEEGLMGSTEWAEQHAAALEHAVAYFNTDVAVSGPVFNAGALPSLRQFVREVTREVPSPGGGTVYDRWKKDDAEGLGRRGTALEPAAIADAVHPETEVRVGELGSGSDYTPFLHHLGVPATDIGSDGPFGVYHTVYDNFDWFTRFADPDLLYTQQQARVFGLEVLHMADADVLPLDYEAYAHEIRGYMEQARSRALGRDLKLEWGPALAAAERLEQEGAGMLARQRAPGAGSLALDRALCTTERALLLPEGLPRRPWYRHSIYAPGEFTGYAAVVIPGVNEAIDASDAVRGQAQLRELTRALDRAADVLRAGAAGIHE
ncbi:MAG: M28 family metallopeptidase [Acidobacteriota bacterium]|nr:M28 family metallopeptidase [Acidobacteriota bacterium]